MSGSAVRQIDFTAGREVVAKRERYKETAQAIATALFAAEGSLVTSALDLNRLQAVLIEERRRIGVSPIIGQDLVRTSTHASAKVVEALEAVVEFHTVARAEADRFGLRMNFGADDKNNNGNVWDPGAA